MVYLESEVKIIQDFELKIMEKSETIMHNSEVKIIQDFELKIMVESETIIQDTEVKIIKDLELKIMVESEVKNGLKQFTLELLLFLLFLLIDHRTTLLLLNVVGQ